MNWLKTVGKAVLKYGKLVPGFQQYFQFLPALAALTPNKMDDALAPVIVSELNQLVGVIVATEAAGQAISASGDQKLQMAAPQVAQVILGSAAMAGHEIADDVLFQKACTEIAGGVADLMNSLKAKD